MKTLIHCNGHTLKNCIILGQKGIKGLAGKISRCNAEPDFLQETYLIVKTTD